MKFFAGDRSPTQVFRGGAFSTFGAALAPAQPRRSKRSGRAVLRWLLSAAVAALVWLGLRKRFTPAASFSSTDGDAVFDQDPRPAQLLAELRAALTAASTANEPPTLRLIVDEDDWIDAQAPNDESPQDDPPAAG